jgi:hypothetical protein
MTFTDLPAWNVPLWFFFWAPVLVLVLFFLMGRMARRLGVARALEGDWNGYSAADVRKLFDIYGERGRAAYRNTILPADAAFAVVYAVVGGVIIAGLMARGLPVWAALLCGLPWLVGGLADLMEGFSLSRLFDVYPKITDGDTVLASNFTRIKLMLFPLGIVGVILAFVLAARPSLLVG